MKGCCNNIKPASIYFTLFDRLSKMRIELKMSFGCWVYLLRKGQKSVWTEFVLWLFKKKMAFRRLVSLLKHWSSCQNLVATRRWKGFVVALCSADILAVQIWEGNTDDALLLSTGLPGLFTGGYFSFQAPEGFPNVQVLAGDIPRGLWVLLLRGQPGQRVSRNWWVPSGIWPFNWSGFEFPRERTNNIYPSSD